MFENLYITSRCGAWLSENYHLVLVDFPSLKLYVLNPELSAICLMLIDSNLNKDELINSCSSQFGISRVKASEIIDSLIKNASSIDFIKVDNNGRFKFEFPTLKNELSIQALENDWTKDFIIEKKYYKFGDQPFSIVTTIPSSFDQRQIKSNINFLFKDFELIDNKKNCQLSNIVLLFEEEGILLSVDQSNGFKKIKSKEAVTEIIIKSFEISYPNNKILCFFHAAGLSIGESGMVLAGVSGAGKSTLSSFLFHKGWSYLGDDTIGIGLEKDTNMPVILPFPTPAKIKRGSHFVLRNLYPEIEELPDIQYGPKVARFLTVDRAKTNLSKPKIKILVFPKYVSGSKLIIKKINPIDALVELEATGMTLQEGISGSDIDVFLHVLSQLPIYRAVYSDLDEVSNWFYTIANNW